MRNRFPYLRGLAVPCVAASLLWTAPARAAVPCTYSEAGGWWSSPKVGGMVDPGLAGTPMTVQFTNPTTGASTNVDVMVRAGGAWSTVIPAAAGTGWTVRPIDNCDPATATYVLANVTTPPPAGSTAQLAILPGSTVTVGGSLFTLAGSYAFVATSLDDDPRSPTFGLFSGFVPSTLFSLSGAGPSGALALLLTADQPFSVNLNAGTGDQTPFSIALSGVAVVNGTSSPFNGLLTGTATSGPGLAESEAFTLSLASNLGQITGSGTSAGTIRLATVPEPTSGASVAIGLAALLAGIWRRRTS